MNKVLVIEDEDLVREGIELILQINGFEVYTAANGKLGIDAARSVLPDLIVSDIMMPIMDGYAVLEQLRADPTTATIPFLFLSAKADRSDIRQGMNLGADDYLTKPFDIEDLLKAVQSRFAKQKAFEQKGEEKLQRLRSNLSFSMPHELLTPLNGILGYTKVLRESYRELSQDDVHEMLDEISASGNRLHRVILNFLLYSRLELLSTNPQSLSDLRSALCPSIHELCFSQAEAKASAYLRMSDLHAHLDDAAIACAPDYLSKMLEELVDNAFKFSSAGQRVDIRGEVRGHAYVLNITNEGRGMTPEQIASIGGYQQFDRDKHEQQGAGLGLAISKKLTELLGGTLEIKSSPGGQTSITVGLQLHAEHFEMH